MNPTWVTILVGLLSGALGSTLTTMLRISHERGAELRGRMLDTADDFAAASAAAFHASTQWEMYVLRLPDEEPLLGADQEWNPDVSDLRDKLRFAVNDAQVGFARLGLLFGPESEAVAAADSLIVSMRDVETNLGTKPDSVRHEEVLQEFQHSLTMAAGSLERFSRTAPATARRYMDSPHGARA